MKKIQLIAAATALLFFATSCATQKHTPSDDHSASQEKNTEIVNDLPKKGVPIITGMIILHPDSISYQGNDGQYWIFSDALHPRLWVTENPTLYPLFAKHLLVELKTPTPGVVLGGTNINPLVIFTKEQIKNMILLGLNPYDMVKITGYGTIPDANTPESIVRTLLGMPQKKVEAKEEQNNTSSSSSSPNQRKSSAKKTADPNTFDPKATL